MKKLIVLAFTVLLGGSLLFSEKPVQEKPDKDSLTDAKFRPKFPLHWGKPPAAQTKDLVDLPGDLEKEALLWQDGSRKTLKKTRRMAKNLWLNAPNPNLVFQSNGEVLQKFN